MFADFKELLARMLEQRFLGEARKLVDAYSNVLFHEDEEIVHLKAVLCYYEQNLTGARLLVEKGIQRFPRSAQLYDILGLLSEETGGQKDAFLCYREAVRFGNDLPNFEEFKTTYQSFCREYPEIAGKYAEVSFDDGYCFSTVFLEEKKKIAVFAGGLPILDYIAGQFIKAYRGKGHIVFVFDKDNFEESSKGLLEFGKDGLDAAVLFNNSGFLLKADSGEVLWDIWQVPCYNIIVDHPMYYFDTLDEAPENGILVCADQNHVKYVRRFYPLVRRCRYLPTGGERLLTNQKYTKEEYAKREIEVLFIGSYKFHEEVEQDDFFQQAFQFLVENPGETVEDAVEKLIREEGRVVSDEELKTVIQKYRFLDTNINAHFRYLVIKELVTAGIPVTVYGNGWDKTAIFTHPCFRFKGTVAPFEGIKLMQNAKIVLNNMAWFKAGASERIFNAMLQGAVCLTDDSKYLRAEFEDGKDIVFYGLQDIHKLPVLANGILEDEERAFAIAKAGEIKALGIHEWKNRALGLL